MEGYPEPHEETDEHPILQLIPGSDPPQFLHQCAQWPSSCSTESSVFSRIGAVKHDRWSEWADECEHSESGDPRMNCESQQNCKASEAGPLGDESKDSDFEQKSGPNQKRRASSPDCLNRRPMFSTESRPMNPLDLLLHQELSLGSVPSWRGKRGRPYWEVPSFSPGPAKSTSKVWDSISRAVMYPRIRSTHLLDRSFGKGACFAVRYRPSDGKILLAGYENGGFDVVDSTSESLHHVGSSHQDCVNNLRWMEENTFSSCSDDGCMALWDIRLLAKPTQTIPVYRANCEHNSHRVNWNKYLKDMTYMPATHHHPAVLVVSTFSSRLFCFSLRGGMVYYPLGRTNILDMHHYNNRTVVIPEDSPFGGHIIQATHKGPALIAGAVEWLNLQTIGPGLPCVLSRRRDSVDPIRNLTLDPLGKGVVVGRSRRAPHNDHMISSVMYLRLLPHADYPDLIGSAEPKFFLPQKASQEILQQPAFSPNGFFLAAPQDRRVDILTNGHAAMPFSEYTGSMEQFTQAAVVPLPKCGDIMCCAVSPADNVTIASGCNMGHVHFAQPHL
ncbi:hypothetical protein BV898_15499 [Hypsibius exemplaris]|uniref:Uncharacterized protein n=1 Tax=Hypsibius exemplaris TaxID=2072580 RepID=A0A9X6NCX8_HYPEX|nr:hypothetical protein BV898_15499 [Hypsibius exemplaris]